MKLIVTAGPTREHLDPVRYLSNPSTGKMGFAIADVAARRGHEVVLIAGPVCLKTPKKVVRIDVVCARDMSRAVKEVVAKMGKDAILIATAAVADWRPASCAKRKLKKQAMNGVLKLTRNPDILKSIKGITKVGFAAETNEMIAEAARKCREKALKFIVANDVTQSGAGFGSNTNQVTLVFPNGEYRELPMMSKHRVALQIIKELER